MGSAWMSGGCQRKRKIERYIFKWLVRMEPHYLTLCGLKRLQDGCVRCLRWRRSGACGRNNLWSSKEPCFSVFLIGIKPIIKCVNHQSCEHMETRPSLSGTGKKFVRQEPCVRL